MSRPFIKKAALGPALLVFLAAFTARLIPIFTLPYNTGLGAVGQVSVDLGLSLITHGRMLEYYGYGDINRAVLEKTPIDKVPLENLQGTTTNRAPVYPLVLAAAIGLQGHLGMTGVQVFQAVMDSLAAVLVFLTLAFLFSRRWSLAGGLIYALWPPYVLYSFGIHDGALSGALNVVILFLAVREFRQNRIGLRAAVLVGVLAAAANLIRPNALWLIPWFCFAVLFLFRGKWGRKLAASALFVLTFLLGVSPWVVRNYYHYGQAVLGSPNVAVALWEGLGDFPDMIPEYAELNRDERILPFAAANGYTGPTRDFARDKEGILQLNGFLAQLFREKVLKAHPFRYLAHLGVKGTCFFLGHRHILIARKYLKLPFGASIADIVDWGLLPLTLLALPVMYFRSRTFWLFYLFPLFAFALFSIAPINDLRGLVSSTVNYPAFFVFFLAGARFLIKGGRFHELPGLLADDQVPDKGPNTGDEVDR